VVMVLVQDLMDSVDQWSPIALTARIPVIGVHLPSSLLPADYGARWVSVGPAAAATAAAAAAAAATATPNQILRGDSAMVSVMSEVAEDARVTARRVSVGEDQDSRIAAVVVAAACAVLGIGGSGGSGGGEAPALVFAALSGTAAAGAYTHPRFGSICVTDRPTLLDIFNKKCLTRAENVDQCKPLRGGARGVPRRVAVPAVRWARGVLRSPPGQ